MKAFPSSLKPMPADVLKACQTAEAIYDLREQWDILTPGLFDRTLEKLTLAELNRLLKLMRDEQKKSKANRAPTV